MGSRGRVPRRALGAAIAIVLLFGASPGPARAHVSHRAIVAEAGGGVLVMAIDLSSREGVINVNGVLMSSIECVVIYPGRDIDWDLWTAGSWLSHPVHMRAIGQDGMGYWVHVWPHYGQSHLPHPNYVIPYRSRVGVQRGSRDWREHEWYPCGLPVSTDWSTWTDGHVVMLA